MLNVAVVGMGWWGKIIVPLLKTSSKITVGKVVEVNPDSIADFAREQGVQVVVMGHTHIPVRLELPDGVLANTGTCSRGRFMGVSVDTGTGEVRLLSR